MANFPFGDVGPARVYYNPSVEVDLGLNMTGNFRGSDDVAEVKNSTVGTAPVDIVFTGRKIEFELSMAQNTLAQLNAVTHASAITGTAMIISNPAGTSGREDNSGFLTVKRVKDGAVSETNTEWINFPIAVPIIDFDMTWDGEGGQRMYKVVFRCLPVEIAGTPTGWAVGELCSIGTRA